MRRISYGVFLFLLATFLVSGCTIDPYTGEKKVSKTAWGTGIGAVTLLLAGTVAFGVLPMRRHTNDDIHARGEIQFTFGFYLEFGTGAHGIFRGRQ